MRKFITLLQAGELQESLGVQVSAPGHLRTPDTIIVDNTNVNVHSISPYIGVACAFGVLPRIVYVRDPGTAMQRQQHKVPEFNWNAMRYQLNELLSKWPGIWPKLEPVLS